MDVASCGISRQDEQKALAKDLLNASEAWLPWQPIPARFSQPWQVSVFQVEEDYGEERQPGENLTIALAVYTGDTDTTPGRSKPQAGTHQLKPHLPTPYGSRFLSRSTCASVELSPP